MYPHLGNVNRKLTRRTWHRLGAEFLTPEESYQGDTDPPIVELKRIMKNGERVWVGRHGRRKPMLKIESKNGKAESLIQPGKAPLSVTLYDTALTQSAYGFTPQLGDLFNDIMGAVVGTKTWDSRPDWMKKIRVKPDPKKILRAVPPAKVEAVVNEAAKYGVNLYYGGQPVAPTTAGYGYAYGVGGAAAALGQVPGWVWLAGGGVVLVLVMGMGRR